ncbi:MAG TPA: hypothetical protein VKU85_21055, partial [bacterium]|nr:hypothetical protein [bacterium]
MRCLFAAVWIGALAGDPAPRQLSVEELHEDLDVFEVELKACHAGLDRYLDEFELEEWFEETYAALDRPMTALELYPHLARFLTAVRCGHTALTLPPGVRGHVVSTQRALPLRLTFLGRRAYVLRNLSADSGVPVGAEVLAINGRTMADILTELLTYLPGDADVENHKLYRLNRRFTYWYSVLLDRSPVFEVAVETLDG